MAKISPKQIDRPMVNPVWLPAPGVNIPAASNLIVTTQMAGKTAGGSLTAMGVITDAPHNYIQMRTVADGKAIYDPNTGRAVFGRLTFASNVWTLNFFTLVGGTETAFNFSGHPQQGVAMTFRYCEMVPFEQVDPFSEVYQGEGVDELMLNGVRKYYRNALTVSTNGQTSITLPKAPAPDSLDLTELTVNGQAMEYGTDYTISGSTLTWVTAQAGFALSTTDKLGIRVYAT